MDPRRSCREPTSCSPTPGWPRRAELGGALVKAAVARAQELARAGAISPAGVADAAVAALPPTAASLTPVINATGVIVHTNLGRAPLSAAAARRGAGRGGLHGRGVRPGLGTRGRRGAGALAALRAAVPAAGAVHVVNNNAAALVLAATALAAGREIIVSRGELIEIGDGFRLPDLLQSTGARIREVGTTNRTALADYQRAIGADTAFILKVHPSNSVIEGFTASVGVGELAWPRGAGGRRHRLRPAAPHPLLPDEPDADSWLRAGAGLVTASGDKLLGGPQAGLLLGRADTVTRLARHPLARALRVDKLTLAALEATLTGPAPPVAQALAATPESIRARAEAQAAAAGRRWRRLPGGASGRRRRRRRRPRCAAAERRAVPARARWRRRCGRARRCAAATCPRSSAGSRAAGCCSTCAPSCPPTTSG